MNRSDEEIVSLVQNGDAESFGILVERYEGKISRYARRFLSNQQDIQDLVQNIFLKSYVNIQSFNTSKRFSPWLYRIAHNEFVNYLKKRKREPLPFFDADTIFPHPVAKEKTDQEVNDADLKEMFSRFFSKLDPKYREPVLLYYFENLSYEEIAEVLHIPASTVGVRLSRAKKLLKELYQDEQ